MLHHLHIKNFAIIENLDMELTSGMTVITGETGAGKSIVIDALDIALGDRADPKMVRHGTDKAEINLSFDIQNIPLAKTWLQDKSLLSENDCIVRRIITREGRSRNFINGTAVTLQQVRELGTLLVHVHGQHQHQSLIRRDEQRYLLDCYGHHQPLLKQAEACYVLWQDTEKKMTQLLGQNQDHSAEITLLTYQIEELKTLALQPGECEALFAEQKQLSASEGMTKTLEVCLARLCEDPAFNLLEQSQLLQRDVEQLHKIYPLDDNLRNLINEATIALGEAEGELQVLSERIEINPERLQTVEHRLNTIHDIARKHKIKVEALHEHQTLLERQLNELENTDIYLEQLQQLSEKQLKEYQIIAEKLTKKRLTAGKKLQKLITGSMQTLGMVGGTFKIIIDAENNPKAHGQDRIEFQVSANPGHPIQPLSKVASGGELARMSLAIQVITAQKDATPTLIFDEVDVGIGGGTAEMIGKLLRKLGQNAQVLCITHLPQVASQGHHHLHIGKTTQNKTTLSNLRFLSEEERIHEIARMVGGLTITEQTIAHAKEMLTCSD